MRRSLSAIIGLGIITAIFMAIMSMFYLQQIPTKADLERLEDDLRRGHSLYLSATSELEITLVRPEKEGDRSSLRVETTLRADIRRRGGTVELYLGRIAQSVLEHPDWRGRIASVTVRHTPPLDSEVTRFAQGAQAKQ